MEILKQAESNVPVPSGNFGYIFLDSTDKNKLKVKTKDKVITYDTSDATATSYNILAGKTAYVNRNSNYRYIIVV